MIKIPLENDNIGRLYSANKSWSGIFKSFCDSKTHCHDPYTDTSAHLSPPPSGACHSVLTTQTISAFLSENNQQPWERGASLKEPQPQRNGDAGCMRPPEPQEADMVSVAEDKMSHRSAEVPCHWNKEGELPGGKGPHSVPGAHFFLP